MTTNLPPLDKAEIARTWHDRAPAWNRRAAELEKQAARMNAPLVETADIRPGQRILDLASGAGEPALTLARAVGSQGEVVATDMVDAMLEGTRRRAAEAGLANLRAEIADMESLPFADASFDRVTCRFGIMFVPDPARALGEALRVLAPGGRAAWMVWGPIEDTTLFQVLQSEARAFLGLAPDPNLAQFRFGPAGLLSALLDAAGFTDVEEKDVYFTPAPPAGVPFWEPNLEMSFESDLAGLDAARRAALSARLEAAFAAFLDGDRYRLKAHARIGTGRRPA